MEVKKYVILDYFNIYMLKYQVCLAVQHLDTQTILKKQKYFFPSSTLRKAEQGTLYEMNTKYKVT